MLLLHVHHARGRRCTDGVNLRSPTREFAVSTDPPLLSARGWCRCITVGVTRCSSRSYLHPSLTEVTVRDVDHGGRERERERERVKRVDRGERVVLCVCIEVDRGVGRPTLLRVDVMHTHTVVAISLRV